MAYRYQSPPNWPTPPEGWVPPSGWQPDPSWPAAPVGWQFWATEPEAPPTPVASSAAAPAQTSKDHGHGLFGGKKAATEENERLRTALEQLGALDAVALAATIEEQRAELAGIQAQIAEAQTELATLGSEVVETREIALLQAAGVYAYAHPLDNAVGYKDLLARVKLDTKAMVSAGDAVLASTSWQVNGSLAQGRVMVRDFSKLLLRAYNAEADNCIRTVKPHSRAASQDRLTKAALSIARLGKTMDIRISEQYHQLRLYEISLTADYLAKVEEEKERNRAERERMRDDEAARRDFEREKQRLAKEQDHVQTALQRLEAAGDTAGAETMRAKLIELGAAMESVISREANIRMGYVYVISNIGAFGPDMVKIGLTRRRDPMDRIRELGDASVPFLFDVHALVFHEDAVSLETRLHTELGDRRVNRINNRREFFYATPAEVREKLSTIIGTHLLEYTEEPKAEQWRATQGMSQTPGGRHAAQPV